jgi:hypothetical protein
LGLLAMARCAQWLGCNLFMNIKCNGRTATTQNG